MANIGCGVSSTFFCLVRMISIIAFPASGGKVNLKYGSMLFFAIAGLFNTIAAVLFWKLRAPDQKTDQAELQIENKEENVQLINT